MKRLFVMPLIALLFFTAGSAAWYVNKVHHNSKAGAHTVTAEHIAGIASQEKLNRMAAAAKQYATANKYNTRYCFLIDMAIASGKQRFFVYDMVQRKVCTAGLVTHGRCNQNWLTGRKYGNAVGCGCTSPGRYMIGNAYRGRFELAYKLYGMDSTNSNAYARFLVLHSMQCVPEREVDPYPICQSDGCPTVSPGFLQQLAVLTDASKLPVLLWIYE